MHHLLVSFECQSSLLHLHRPPHMADFQIRLLLNVVFRVFTAFITCTGALIGIITGAIKGQATETGMLRGAGAGAVSGAIVALQAVDMIANGEPFSKVYPLSHAAAYGRPSVRLGLVVLCIYPLTCWWLQVALLRSLLHGKLFIEWTSAMETSFTDMFDMENTVTRGLSEEDINDLPKHVFEGLSNRDDTSNETNCVICLQALENKEEGRELPSCRHVFHVQCIDEWLIRQGSCPVCRRNVIV
ncbi:putative transcription factor C2H2 family [Helianthus debilis subsp. tardiflorus]